jgi:hypothetical protein
MALLKRNRTLDAEVKIGFDLLLSSQICLHKTQISRLASAKLEFQIPADLNVMFVDYLSN